MLYTRPLSYRPLRIEMCRFAPGSCLPTYHHTSCWHFDPLRYLLSPISTWRFSNTHVDILYSPRGRESFPPKFHLIPPKFYFFPTWRIFICHVEI